MTHDKTCTFDPKHCRDCKLQAEARADERKKAAQRVKALADYEFIGAGPLVGIAEAAAAARGGGETSGT